MAIEQRSAAWRIVQSWYVLLTLPFGFTSWLAFLYLAMRAARFKWFLWSVIYFGTLIFAFTRPEVIGADGQSTLSGLAGFTWMGMWIFSIFHALVVRRQFLTILDAREGGTVQAPRPKPFTANRTLPPGTSPEFFALFEEPGQSSPAPEPVFSGSPLPRHGGTTGLPEPEPADAARTLPPGTSPEFFALFEAPPESSSAPEPAYSEPPLPSIPPQLPQRVPATSPAARPRKPAPIASRPPLPSAPPPPPPPPPPPAALPRPFSGPAPFGGRRPFADDGRPARPAPPAPPPPPRRRGGQDS